MTDRHKEARLRRERLRSEKDSTLNPKALPMACLDERSAVEFLERQRWGDSPACPKCGDMDVYQMRDRETGERNKRCLWRCNGCGDQFTVRIGTVFEESRIPLKHWCYAFWAACASKKGVSALQIRRQTQVSYKSALFMMHRIRYAMSPVPDAPKLDGIVEADETWVGGKTRPASRAEWRRQKAEGAARVRNKVKPKTPVMAMVRRDGDVCALVLPSGPNRLGCNALQNARLLTGRANGPMLTIAELAYPSAGSHRFCFRRPGFGRGAFRSQTSLFAENTELPRVSGTAMAEPRRVFYAAEAEAERVFYAATAEALADVLGLP